MKKGIAFCFVAALVVLSFGLAACGGGDQAQQQSGQQSAQPNPPAQSSNRATSGLVGTWEVVETDSGTDADLGGLLTFSSDGTFQTQPFPEDAPEMVLDGQYRADGTHIYMIDPETGYESPSEYTLNGDTLTMHKKVEDPQFPIDQTATYKRKS